MCRGEKTVIRKYLQINSEKNKNKNFKFPRIWNTLYNKTVFQNFDAGRSYNKTVTISNVSNLIKKIRFLKFEFTNTYDEVIFEVESFGIKKLFTGCKVKFYVNFEPYDPLEKYEGKMVFLSYDIKLCQYYHTEIPIKCVPKYSDLKIYPELVSFGAIPVWRASKYGNSKIVKVRDIQTF